MSRKYLFVINIYKEKYSRVRDRKGRDKNGALECSLEVLLMTELPRSRRSPENSEGSLPAEGNAVPRPQMGVRVEHL